MKLVTFAIAAYNHASFVRESLESVWHDGYPHKEIIIIDDGSTDATASVIRDWCVEKDWQGITFSSGPNAGITATLNKLISAATGDYIRLVSSDDLLLPGGTEKMVRMLAADDTAVAAFGDAVLIDRDGRVTCESILAANGANRARLTDPARLTEEIITNWAVSGPVILIKRQFFIDYGMYDETLLVDDWDLYLRVAAIGGLRFIDEAVAKYRIHGGNASRTAERARRIKNLSSQARVADQNAALFGDARSRDLLASEKQLLQAKIAYLSNQWLRCGALVLLHLAHKVKAALRRGHRND